MNITFYNVPESVVRDQQKNASLPVLRLGGNISHIIKSQTYKCSMCGETFDTKNECPIAHSMLCTGF